MDKEDAYKIGERYITFLINEKKINIKKRIFLDRM